MTLTKHSTRTIRNPKCGHVNRHYWAKDDATGRYYLIDANDATRPLASGDAVSSAHISECHRGKRPDDDSQAPESHRVQEFAPEPEEAPEMPKEAPKVTNDNSAEETALETLRRLLGSSVDRQTVVNIVKEEMANVIFPTQTVVLREGRTPKPVEGITHERFARALRWLSLGSHVYLYGPASSGKSHMGKQAAEALGLDYVGLFPVSAGTMDSDLMGYIVPGTGDYHGSGLYRAVANGGIYVIDEVDKGHPGIIAILNAITANGSVEFPCGLVKVHPDFRLIVTGNTFGTGPDALYVGSQQLDAATLTRFRRIEIPYDYALETALCSDTGLDAGRVALIVNYVKALRGNVTKHRLSLIFAPRQTVALCLAIADGMPWAEAWEDSMQAGISPTDWAKVSDEVKAPVI